MAAVDTVPAETAAPKAAPAVAVPAVPAEPKTWLSMDMEARCKRIYDEFLTRTEPRIRELEAEIDNWESLAERAEFRLDRLQRTADSGLYRLQRSAAGLDEDKEMAVMDEIARYEMFAKQASQALNDFHIYNDYRAHLESNVESLQSLLEDNRTDWLRVERRLERKGLTDDERAALTAQNESIKAVGAELLAEYDAFNEEWRRYEESMEVPEEPEPDYNLVRAMIGNPGRDI